MGRLALSKQHAAAVCIQKIWRRHTVQTQYSHTLQAVISIQVKVLLLFGRGTTASLLRSYTQTNMHAYRVLDAPTLFSCPVLTAHTGVVAGSMAAIHGPGSFQTATQCSCCFAIGMAQTLCSATAALHEGGCHAASRLAWLCCPKRACHHVSCRHYRAVKVAGSQTAQAIQGDNPSGCAYSGCGPMSPSSQAVSDSEAWCHLGAGYLAWEVCSSLCVSIKGSHSDSGCFQGPQRAAASSSRTSRSKAHSGSMARSPAACLVPA